MKNQEGNLLVGQEDIAHQWTQYFSTFFNVPENMPTEEDRAEEDVPADKEEYPITLDKVKMRFRLVPKSSTLDDLKLLYVQIFSEFCASWHVWEATMAKRMKIRPVTRGGSGGSYEPPPHEITRSTL